MLLLLGGRGKRLSPAPLVEAVAKRGALAFLFGEIEEELAHALLERCLPFVRCGSMEKAIEYAMSEACPGDTVLLSPAATSYDAYRDFEERGDVFRHLVNQRKG